MIKNKKIPQESFQYIWHLDLTKYFYWFLYEAVNFVTLFENIKFQLIMNININNFAWPSFYKMVTAH